MIFPLTKLLVPTHVCDDCGTKCIQDSLPAGWFRVRLAVDSDGELGEVVYDGCSRGCAERLAVKMVRELIG